MILQALRISLGKVDEKVGYRALVTSIHHEKIFILSIYSDAWGTSGPSTNSSGENHKMVIKGTNLYKN